MGTSPTDFFAAQAARALPMHANAWQWFLASTTWRHPLPGLAVTLIVIAIGGGAGGTETTHQGGSANGAGGGGGSGRFSITTQTNVTTDQAITIGTAGAAGIGSTTTNPTAGGTTTFGSLVSVAGGSAVAFVASATGGTGGSGGCGGGGGGGASAAGGVGGAGLDFVGGGVGAGASNAGFAPGVSAIGRSQPWASAPSGIASEVYPVTIPGGWPNGGGNYGTTGLESLGGGGGDCTPYCYLLMGRGAGGTGAKGAALAGADANGTAGLAGAVIVLIQPFV